MTTTPDRQALFTGTDVPPEHLALDAAALGAFLADKVDGLGTDFLVEKFKGGQSNPTYKLTGEATYVLRRRPPGQLLASAHAIDREYRVMAALSRAGFPVPKTYLYCDDESVIGSAFYVVSFNPGRVFWNADLPGVPAGDRTAIYADMNARLAQLHQLDPAALGLADFGRTDSYAARNLARWSKVYEQSKLVDVPDMDWLMRTLPDHVPAEAPICLLHGDYGLYNIIVEADRPQVMAAIDWEMSTLGDPFIDLTHHIRPWWEPQDDSGAATSLRGHDLDALGIPSMDAYIDLYCRNFGIAELPHRRFYIAFAQFRYAAMIQGILKRAAIGTSSNRVTLHTQDRMIGIAAMARATLEGAA